MDNIEIIKKSGIKIRKFPEHNYRAVNMEGKTLRFQIDPDKPITNLDYPEFWDIKITNVCNLQCNYCFVKGTQILTPNGYVNIEDMKKGDICYAYDVTKKLRKENKVEQLFSRKYKGKIVNIELEDGRSLHLTPNHKIYTINRGWIEASEISITDDVEMF